MFQMLDAKTMLPYISSYLEEELQGQVPIEAKDRSWDEYRFESPNHRWVTRRFEEKHDGREEFGSTKWVQE